MLCDDLEGWNGVGRRGAQDGGDIGIHTVDSRCCRAETITTS